MNGDARAPAHRRRAVWAAGLFAFGVAVVVFVRLRSSWPAYVGVHRWLAERGVPDWARNLDYPLIMLGAALLGGLAARTLAGVAARDALLLRLPRKGWVRTVVLGSAPVVLGGLVLMLVRGVRPGLDPALDGVVRAPLVEEVFFRGLLVGAAVAVLRGAPVRPPRERVSDGRSGGLGFWTFAVAGALVFGSVHAAWSLGGLASGWPNVLVTAVGGVWYAWLMRSWRSVLVPMVLHAAMNLCWVLAMPGSSGAAGGGLYENLLRAATIALVTWLTIRSSRDRL